MAGSFLEQIGGAKGCRRLSTEFYGRVAKDPVLRPFFPGKSMRCAINEFTAFLIEFLGGDEDLTQDRWWLSLRESHARFEIGVAERNAWLADMSATIDAIGFDAESVGDLRQFFEQASLYIIGNEATEIQNRDLASRWSAQRDLDRAINAIRTGREDEAMELATRFRSRPSIFVGLLARLSRSGRPDSLRFVTEEILGDSSVISHRFGGRSLLHYASGSGCLEIVTVLLQQGVDPNALDRGGHTPLYAVANECGMESGPHVARALIAAGADVNAHGGVTRATALHMAARRGHVAIALVLIEAGASLDAIDSKGETPVDRAVNCRKHEIAKLLADH